MTSRSRSYRTAAWPGLLLGLLATVAHAGEYHFGQTLLCSDCHTMHFSQSHNWDGTTPVPAVAATNGNWLGTAGPNSTLLKRPAAQLCLACHDGQTFAPDVYGAATAGTSYVRQAGAITTGQAPYEEWKGHTLDPTPVGPPGGSSLISLQCVTCHAHHGNANYRNVGGASLPLRYAKGTNNTTMDVFLRSWVPGEIATNYSVENVDFNEPGANASALGRFCRGCHTDFHGGAYDSNMYDPAPGAWLRHPTAGVNIGAIGGGHSSLATFASRPYRVQVMSASGDWGPRGAAWPAPPANLTPSCMSCHKSHGNQNPFGLIFLAGTGPLTEEGDAAGNAGPASQRYQSLCRQCHVQ